jgi:N-acetylneuraminate synthase
METEFDFDGLFVFEMANNHQGRLDHGLNIVREMGRIAKEKEIKAALKLQFRNLDTLIHPDHVKSTANKQIPRFLSTRLSRDEFAQLVRETRAQGMLTMASPFDEESVDFIEELDLDAIKVASCSAKDWPLLERIAEACKPVIFSTGGLLTSDIDKLVSFFDHKGVRYAIMHCVGLYPIPNDKFHLNQIEALARRYPNRVIGWSTHERPSDFEPVQLAFAKGARMFERHVGIETDDIKLNAYSSTPDQVLKWIDAYRRAKTLCGSLSRPLPSKEETDSLLALERGVYCREAVDSDETIPREKVFFALPRSEGQLASGQWKEGIVARRRIGERMPIGVDDVALPADPPNRHIKSAVHEVKALLNEAGVHLSSEFSVEYSHHYGMENFRKTGCVLIDCINREYCKKIIVQLPGQNHPLHYHKRKEETFQVLHGILHIEIDGHHRVLSPGETVLVLPGVWHRFWTETGCVAEEVSTTHFLDDSIYQDKKINKLAREDRKTVVDHWGRFQLSAGARREKPDSEEPA